MFVSKSRILVLAHLFMLALVVSCDQDVQDPVSSSESLDYLEIINTDIDNPQEDDVATVSDALLKLMNNYQAKGMQDECVELFSQIAENPTTIIKNELWRDFNSIYAYALYRDDEDDKAQELMDFALSIEYDSPTDYQIFRDYSYAAAIVYGNPNRQDDAITYCKIALDAAERASLIGGVQWTTSILGRLYQKHGMMADALELYKKSINQAMAIGDVPGLANAYNVMSDIFVFWNLPDAAEQYSDRALLLTEEVRLKASSVAGDTYRIRARIKECKGEIDSALYYLNKSIMIYEVLPYNSGQDEADLALGAILIKQGSDSYINTGIKHLERVINNATRLEPKAVAYAHLAMLYNNQGDNLKCEELMSALYELMSKEEIADTYLDEDVCRFAFEFFISQENVPAAELFSSLYIEQIERRSEDNISRAIAIAAQENITIEHEREVKKILTYLVIIISSIIVVVMIMLSSLLLFHRGKRKKLIAELNDMSRIVKRREDMQEASDNVIVPQLYRKNGEAVFKAKFEALYPEFLPLLRKSVSNISRNDEILCMMIALGQDINQIAYNMGIEKTSVNQARYRLRKKMGLQKEESLKNKILELTNI